eukprot:CAMPEP_0176447816 /NCGR_PEP_ID=MMETSP0127-20121128/25302_1 /TAXON_ID=938130 /ORGANISM="Platyophrya macrostoma, Strain WH" /LENGTH=216 /DNA_ID=CAMNT_0017834425 /DNA_START=30 /DNA_END=681 /DNA_ORIENTATION=+
MESTQTQYRLLSVKKKPFHNEKHTFGQAGSKKQKTKPFESQLNPKASHYYSKKSTQKPRKSAKYQNYTPEGTYYPQYSAARDHYQGAYFPGHQYYPQYYMPSPMGYPELLVPVYGYLEKSHCDQKAAEENSPQDLGNSGCPTVASEEDLNNLNGDECEVKVVCNGNVIHTQSHCEQGASVIDQSTISLSDYEEFVQQITGNEPKSEAISMPNFLLE